MKQKRRLVVTFEVYTDSPADDKTVVSVMQDALLELVDVPRAVYQSEEKYVTFNLSQKRENV